MSAESISETLAIVAAGEHRYGIIDGPRPRPVDLHDPAIRHLWSYKTYDPPVPDPVRVYGKQEMQERQDYAVQLYKEGKSRNQIAEILKTTPENAGKILRKGGVIIREQGSAEYIADLTKLFKSKPDGMSISKWAAQVGCTYNQGQYVAQMVRTGKL